MLVLVGKVRRLQRAGPSRIAPSGTNTRRLGQQHAHKEEAAALLSRQHPLQVPFGPPQLVHNAAAAAIDAELAQRVAAIAAAVGGLNLPEALAALVAGVAAPRPPRPHVPLQSLALALNTRQVMSSPRGTPNASISASMMRRNSISSCTRPNSTIFE